MLVSQFFVQVELEKLNSSTDVINKLELDLEVSENTCRCPPPPPQVSPLI